ncbi:hypothetical protein D3C71_1699440 [compost metagenome]
MPSGTLETFCMVISAAMDRMYGTRLVTTARLTRVSNCLLKSGLMVSRASAVCAASSTSMPTIGVPALLPLAKIGRK